jgi:hypothetical protein
LIVDLGPDTSLCDGETITLDAGAGFVSYEWSTSETSQTLEVGLPGDYIVTVTDQLGCTGIDLINVSTGVSPVASFIYNALTGTTVEFTDNGSGASTVHWDFNGDGNVDETTAGGATVQHDFGAESVFGVVMVSENGCGSDTTSQNVLVQDVGIEELKDELGFLAYPNPSSGLITVSIEAASVSLSALTVYDVQGRELQRIGPLFGNPLTLDLNHLESGIYVLQLSTSKGIINERIIKQ